MIRGVEYCGNCDRLRPKNGRPDCVPAHCIEKIESGELIYHHWEPLQPTLSPEFCNCGGDTKVIGHKKYFDTHEQQQRECKVCGRRFFVELRRKETPG